MGRKEEEVILKLNAGFLPLAKPEKVSLPRVSSSLPRRAYSGPSVVNP
jgi:hypothetical protein